MEIISPTLFSRSLKGRYYGNRFCPRIYEIVVLDHSVRWHSTTDGLITTWTCALIPPMNPLRLTKIWVNFAPVISSFVGAFVQDGLHAGLCHAFSKVLMRRRWLQTAVILRSFVMIVDDNCRAWRARTIYPL